MAEAEAGSGRGSFVESLKEEKVELYQTLEALLKDRNFKFLCNIEGIYRDDLIALIKTALRPISKKDANDYVNHWIQIGVFNVVLKDTEFLLPKELLKKKKKEMKGYEVLGELENGMVLLRTFKQFLVPSQELRAVCSVFETRF
jgi:hypothetical protein